MEHKIGEIVTLPDGRKAEVVEEPVSCSCEGCILKDESCYPTITGMCNDYDRTDHKNIIYKEIK